MVRVIADVGWTRDDMQGQRIAAGLVACLGVIGALASVYSIPDNAIRNPLFAGSLVITFVASYLLLASFLDIENAIRNLVTLRKLGIRRVYVDGSSSNEFVRRAVKGAKSIRLITVSGNALIKMLKDDLVYALKENSATVRVLLATPNSQFTRDVEETEGVARNGHISSELVTVDALLREYLSEAKSQSGQHVVIGRIELGHYTTHLRSSVLLCDNARGWLTLNLPPARAVQSPSLELYYADAGLLILCSKHFERIWQVLTARGDLREIAIQQGAAGDAPQAARS